MKKYLVLIAMLLAACGEQGTNDKNSAKDVSSDVAEVAEVERDGNLIKLKAVNAGAIVNAKVGQEIVLELESNANDDKNWQFVTFVGEDNIVEELQAEYIPNENTEGVGEDSGKGVYRLKLLKPGEIIVSANYIRDNEEFDIKKKSDYAVKVVIE